MKKKNLIIGASLAAICASFVSVSPTMAQVNARQPEVKREIQTQQRVPDTNQKGEAVKVRYEQNAQMRVELKKDNAIREIDRRVVSLERLIDKISAMKRVSGDQRSALNAQIETETSNLLSLKEKIIAETDPTALAEHKKSIVNSYRIYALFMPKITIMAHADQVIEVAGLMKAKTTDGSEAWKTIDSAEVKAKTAISSVINLLPSGYPANKYMLEKARMTLKEAIKELNSARPMLANTQ